MDSVLFESVTDKFRIIDGLPCMGVDVFSQLIGIGVHSIYNLVSKGNTQRRLDHIKAGTALWIPAYEYFNFPFCKRGRYGRNNTYFFALDGSTYPADTPTKVPKKYTRPPQKESV